MSAMSDFDLMLQEIRQTLSYEAGTPEQMFEERLERLESEMIEISVLSLDPDQRSLVKLHRAAINKIVLRGQLILSSFDAEEQPKFTVVGGRR